METLPEQGLCPVATRRNLATTGPLTEFSAEVSSSHQLLLADAQTSCGLLMAVPEACLKNQLNELRENMVTNLAVAGQVIRLLSHVPSKLHSRGARPSKNRDTSCYSDFFFVLHVKIFGERAWESNPPRTWYAPH